VPIGAFLCKESCSALGPGDHGTTFGGNPLVAAAAYAGSKYLIDNNIPAYVKQTEKHLFARLHELQVRFSFITEVRGKGLLAAIEFTSDIASQVLPHAHATGVLLNAVKPTALRFMPSLTITAEEIDEGIGRLEQALKKI
jgi:acetylornithine/succinyldiaminopimelate/putrescine aminotransferase